METERKEGRILKCSNNKTISVSFLAQNGTQLCITFLALSFFIGALKNKEMYIIIIFIISCIYIVLF